MAALSELLAYDFHVHTDFVHGASSVQELVEAGCRKGLRGIGIVEHIRKEPTYDYLKLLEEVDQARGKFPLKIFTGLEAKILDRCGTLDCPDELLDRAGVIVVGVLHSVPTGLSQLDCYRGLLLSRANIIGHPVGFPEGLMPELVEREKALELNAKYPLPHAFVEKCLVSGVKFTLGSDAHRADEVGSFRWIPDCLQMLTGKCPTIRQESFKGIPVLSK